MGSLERPLGLVVFGEADLADLAVAGLAGLDPGDGLFDNRPASPSGEPFGK
jgi:hypothetical protein